jgi:hypothetical protein
MTVRLVDLPPSPPKIVTPLWTLSKDHARLDAELVEQGAARWEVRLLRDHEWPKGRRFADRGDASGTPIRRVWS